MHSVSNGGYIVLLLISPCVTIVQREDHNFVARQREAVDFQEHHED